MLSPDYISDLIQQFGLARGNPNPYGGGHARYPPYLGPKRKRIIRPNYSPFANKLPNNSAYFSLDLPVDTPLFQITATGLKTTEKLAFFADRIEREWSTTPGTSGAAIIPKNTLSPLLSSQKTFAWGFRRPFFEFIVCLGFGLALHEGFDRPILRIVGLVFYFLAALKLTVALSRVRRERWIYLHRADGGHLLTLRVNGLQGFSELEFIAKYKQYMQDALPDAQPKV